MLELKFTFIVYFISFPYLQFRIVPTIGAKACAQAGFEFKIKKNDTEINLELDGNINVLASVSLEVGLYFPPFSPGIEMSFSIGVMGILGSGKFGIKDISNLLDNDKSYTLLYYQYQVIQLYYYILFKIEINIKFFKFSFQFYLIRERVKHSCKKCIGSGEKNITNFKV